MPSEADISSTINKALEYIKSVFLDLQMKVTDTIYYKPILKASEINEILEANIEQGIAHSLVEEIIFFLFSNADLKATKFLVSSNILKIPFIGTY